MVNTSTAGRATGVGGVLVHEWLTRAGGSEKVFHTLGRSYPTRTWSACGTTTPSASRARRRRSWLARAPLRGRKAHALPLMPVVWRTLPYGLYEWAILSSHAIAHHARFSRSRDAERSVYVHSPARYLWTPDVDSRGAIPSSEPHLPSSGRPLDRRRAHVGASFAANSQYVRQRILDTWRAVESRVIHPPVAVDQIQAVEDWAESVTDDEARTLSSLPDQFVLGTSRLIPYKRLDLVIDAGARADLPVALAGAGDLEDALREKAATAGIPVTFVLKPSNAMLRALFQRCTVYVFPAVEDFGIMPVEALASGASFVAHSVGGTAEIIEHDRSGTLANFESAHDVQRTAETATATDRIDRIARSRTFSEQAFAGR